MSAAMQEIEAATHSYVGRCPGCKRIIAACVDYPSGKARTAKFCRDIVLRGDTLEHIPTEQVHGEQWGCGCPKAETMADQPTLALGGAA